MSEELEALEAEAEQEDNAPARVTLKTANGQAAIHVPPINKWRSSAKNDLFGMGNDYAWARAVLSESDFEKYEKLDPDGDEFDDFMRSFFKASGTDPKRHSGSGSSSKSTRKR